MRTFLYIVISALIGTAVSLIFQYLIEPRKLFEYVGNIIFFVALAIFVYRSRAAVLVSPASVVLAPLGFILLTLALGLAGIFVMSRSQFLGIVLLSFFGLGFYPDGPDMQFSYAAPLWAFSIIVLIEAAIVLGVVLRVRGGRGMKEAERRG